MVVLGRAGWWLGVGMLAAVIDWIAVAQDRKRLEYVFKPATLIAFIVAAFVLAADRGFDRMAVWFVLALIASLAGDVFLMLPDARWFIPGLLSFLVAQVAYILGLNPTLPPVAALGLVAVAGIIDVIVLRHILAGVQARGEGELRVPVAVYAVVLSMMLVSGWATWLRPTWSPAGRIVVSAGATLFFASDLILAWNRFVRESRLLHVAVIVTYHLAQIALTMAIALAP